MNDLIKVDVTIDAQTGLIILKPQMKPPEIRDLIRYTGWLVNVTLLLCNSENWIFWGFLNYYYYYYYYFQFNATQLILLRHDCPAWQGPWKYLDFSVLWYFLACFFFFFSSAFSTERAVTQFWSLALELLVQSVILIKNARFVRDV